MIYNPIEFWDRLLDINESIKFLNLLESDSNRTLGLLTGSVIGLLVNKIPDLLYQKIDYLHRRNLNKDQVLGLLRATWMFLFYNSNKQIPTQISSFMNYCLSSHDKEISSQALDIAIRFYFNNSMNLRKSIKRYYFRSLDSKFLVCSLSDSYLPILKDEKLVYFIYHNLFKEIIKSTSLDLTIKFSFNLVHTMKRLEKNKMIQYEGRYQLMVIKLVNKFIENNWWEIIKLDHFLEQFGRYDRASKGKELTRLLNKERNNPNFYYFTIFIIKTFNFNIILIDILYLLRAKYYPIFLPTLSLLLEKTSDEIESIFISTCSLADQIHQKINDKITEDDSIGLRPDTYENIIPKIEQLKGFVKNLTSIIFINKEREVNNFLRESDRLRDRIIPILDLFKGIEKLIIEAGNSAPWINMSSLMKKINNQKIYDKIPVFERIILELSYRREPLNHDKVRIILILFH